MESKEVYKRHVLSITSITMAISLLGIICMALYYRNKRHREKFQAHLKENQTLKNYNSNNAPGEEKLISNSNVQTHEYCKRLFQCPVTESSFNHCNISKASCNTFFRSSGNTKQPKKSILFYSPSQKIQPPHLSASNRPPSVSKVRLDQIGRSKCSGSVYKHLQEVDSSKKDSEKGPRTKRDFHYSNLCQDTFLHIQTSVQDKKEPTPVLFPRSSTNICSFRQPVQHQYMDPLFSSASIPIIPSLHCHYDIEVSSLQTMSIKTNSNTKRAKYMSCSAAIGQQQVTLLLEEAQEQLKALAHCKHRKPTTILEASETMCFLRPNMESSNMGNDPHTSIQILSHSKRDLDPSNQ
ncbi:hypothetical protein NL108_010961 [Boleophthalmus pectinirostris]|nr:hypothetical protein NL108_010961 [Boleophthalmus pectinirostris]